MKNLCVALCLLVLLLFGQHVVDAGLLCSDLAKSNCMKTSIACSYNSDTKVCEAFKCSNLVPKLCKKYEKDQTCGLQADNSCADFGCTGLHPKSCAKQVKSKTCSYNESSEQCEAFSCANLSKKWCGKFEKDQTCGIQADKSCADFGCDGLHAKSCKKFVKSQTCSYNQSEKQCTDWTPPGPIDSASKLASAVLAVRDDDTTIITKAGAEITVLKDIKLGPKQKGVITIKSENVENPTVFRSDGENHKFLLLGHKNNQVILEGLSFVDFHISKSNKKEYYQGGVVYGSRETTLTIKNCRFENNKCADENKYAGNGGAVQMSEFGSLTIEDCHFENNYAFYGGAVHTQEGLANITGSTFIGNRAVKDGAAIDKYWGGVMRIESSTFTDNNDSEGGYAVSHDEENIYVRTDCVFTNGGMEPGYTDV